jgi:hypothetical protein
MSYYHGMADTLTVQIEPETAAQLRQVAAANGESVEQAAKRLLAGAAIDHTSPYPDLGDETLEERFNNPGPFATPERVEAVLSRFRPKG